MYYSGFVLANALFVALLAAGLCCAARSRLRRWLSVLAALQVVSWFFVNLFAKGKGDHFNIEVGYYLWLVSFVLLCAAQPAGPTGPEAGEKRSRFAPPGALTGALGGSPSEKNGQDCAPAALFALPEENPDARAHESPPR